MRKRISAYAESIKSANKKVLAQLSLISNKKAMLLRMEFFFYADYADNASNLAIELNKLNYIVGIQDPIEPHKQFCVRGWTIPMNLNDGNVVNDWTDSMSELAIQNDCFFDGWGTNPDQKEEDFAGRF